MKKVQIDLSKAEFTTPGTYFIKLELLTNPPIKLRTSVSSENTQTPIFYQSSFQLDIPNQPSLLASRALPKLQIHACCIKSLENGNVAVELLGVCEIDLFEISQYLIDGNPKTVNIEFNDTAKKRLVSDDNIIDLKESNFIGSISMSISKVIEIENKIINRVENIISESVRLDSDRQLSGGYARILLARSFIESSKSESGFTDGSVSLAAESDSGAAFEKMEERDLDFDDLKVHTPAHVEQIFPKNVVEFTSESQQVQFLESPLNLGLNEDRYGQFLVEPKNEKFTEPVFIFQRKESDTKQCVMVIIHDVWDLPCIRNATTGTLVLPTPFMTLKTEKESIEKKRAKAATHVHSPAREIAFNEALYIEFLEPYAQSNIPSIFLTLADNITKRFIAKFSIPISNVFFPAFRQLSLICRCVSADPSISSPHCRISITNFDETISSPYLLLREYEEKMVVLEFILRGFKHSPLPIEGRVVAVLRIVKDGSEYKSNMATINRRFKDGFPTIHSPVQPHLMLDFDASGKLINESSFSENIFFKELAYNRQRKPFKKESFENKYYQMAMGKGNSLHNTNSNEKHSSRKTHNKPNAFTPETSLVVEFYREPNLIMSQNPFNPEDFTEDFDDASQGRPIDDFFAYSIVPLGDFTIFPVTGSGQIINIDKLKTHFIGKYDDIPGAGSVYCSLDARIPDNWNLLRPKSRKTKSKDDSAIILDVDAMERNIKKNHPNEEFPKRIKDRNKKDPLPDMSFDSLLEEVKKERDREEIERKATIAKKEQANDPTRMIFTFHDIEQRQKLIDRLMQELEARTNAVKKIGGDLYSAREYSTELEQKIKQLNNKISENDIKTVKLLNTIDVDVISVEELKRRYALLAQKLQIEINRTRELTDQLEAAQTIKIESNQLEKKYLEVRQAHKAQATYIQTLQENLKQTTKYKSAIKKQDQVIHKLEILLKDSMGGVNKAKLEEFFDNAKLDPNNFDGGVYRLLTEENQMLKEKLLKLERSSNPTQRSNDYKTEYEIQQLKDSLKSEKEKVELLERNQKQAQYPEDRDVELFKLLMRAEKAESRVQSLESQITESSRIHAKQIVEWKTKSVHRDSPPSSASAAFSPRSNSALSFRKSVTPPLNGHNDSKKPSYFLDPLNKS